jgi:hypothetical protein
MCHGRASIGFLKNPPQQNESERERQQSLPEALVNIRLVCFHVVNNNQNILAARCKRPMNQSGIFLLPATTPMLFPIHSWRVISWLAVSFEINANGTRPTTALWGRPPVPQIMRAEQVGRHD